MADIPSCVTKASSRRLHDERPHLVCDHQDQATIAANPASLFTSPHHPVVDPSTQWSVLTWGGQQLLESVPQRTPMTFDRVVEIARGHVVQTVRHWPGDSSESPSEAVSIFQGPKTIAVAVGVSGETATAAERVEVLLTPMPKRRSANRLERLADLGSFPYR